MNRQEIKAKVDAFLVGELEIDEAKISDDALLKKDLGIDSLDLVDISLRIVQTLHLYIYQRHGLSDSTCSLVVQNYRLQFLKK